MSKFDWTQKVTYDTEAKKAFHAEARKVLRQVAKELELPEGSYEIRNNAGGQAVSGEITLHGDHVYVQVSKGIMGPDKAILIRTCEGRLDYTGGINHFAPIRLMDDPKALATKVLQLVPSAKLGSMAYIDDTVVPFAEKENWHRDRHLVYSLIQDGWVRGQARMVNRVSIQVIGYKSATEEELDTCTADLLNLMENIDTSEDVAVPAQPVSPEKVGTSMMVAGNSVYFLTPHEGPTRRGAPSEVNHIEIRVQPGVSCTEEEAQTYVQYVASCYESAYELQNAPRLGM